MAVHCRSVRTHLAGLLVASQGIDLDVRVQCGQARHLSTRVARGTQHSNAAGRLQGRSGTAALAISVVEGLSHRHKVQN